MSDLSKLRRQQDSGLCYKWGWVRNNRCRQYRETRVHMEWLWWSLWWWWWSRRVSSCSPCRRTRCTSWPWSCTPWSGRRSGSGQPETCRSCTLGFHFTIHLIKAERAIASEALVAQNGWLMWGVYHDLRNGWTNLCETFRDSWEKVGDCPRQRKNLVWSLLKKFLFKANLKFWNIVFAT